MTTPWLQVDAVLAAFAPRRALAVQRYVDFVRVGVGLPPVWEQLRSQLFLGDEAFVSEMLARLGDDAPLRDVPRVQRRPPRRPLAEWQAQHPRDKAMALAYGSGQYRLREIADFFGVHEATVSRAVRAARLRQGQPRPSELGS